MLKALLHRIVAIPLIYDLVQTLVGARLVRKRFQHHLVLDKPDAIVVDLGGGTGLNRVLLPPSVHYFCLDNDPMKLSGFVQKEVAGIPILGDGIQVPIKSASVDMVICTAVIHHISEEALSLFVERAIGLLKPGGKFVFLDAVWVPTRLPARLLWRYDRGAYPRTPEKLNNLMSVHGKVLHWERFSTIHSYVIGVVTKK